MTSAIDGSNSDVHPLVSANPNHEATTEPLRRCTDSILAEVDQHIKRTRLPIATYRVQFNCGCTFRQVEQAVPYLQALGISDLYASPFLQARPGSAHGYDITDHRAINPEIGTLSELRSLSAALRDREMGLIADVVPNHMSATPQYNDWWQDVLENGPSSQYACYFDIDWMPLKPDLADKVLLPILGDQFGKVLESGDLSVQYGDGAFWVRYFDSRFPIAPRSYSAILSPRLPELEQSLGREHPDYQELLSILTAIKNLPPRTETNVERLAERRREKEVIKRRLNDVLHRSSELTEFVEANVRQLNGVPGDPQSFDSLDQLLQDQAYRLAFWRVAADEINYRRFFDINELAAICTEDPRVFVSSHRFLFDLLDEGTVTGLRIDHPDGLYDPGSYLVQLQEQRFLFLCREAHARYCSQSDESIEWPIVQAHLLSLWRASIQFVSAPLARPLYVIVEKILARDEAIPKDWPVHGTVGYDFLNAMNGLFVDQDGERPLSSLYLRFTGQPLEVNELAYQDKRLIVRMSMASELSVLGHRLDRISERNRWTRDFTLSSLTDALREVIACFRVYRSYVRPGAILDRDRCCIEDAVAHAKRRNPAMDASLFDFVCDVLLLRFNENAASNERRAVEQFVGKFQQLTGPIFAKAVEDTTFYRFNRLTSLNEVGGDPSRFGISPDEIHRLNEYRASNLSHSLNASSTHDTKRSEDVRARINVISEIPREWRERVRQWSHWNRKSKIKIDGIEAPSRNAEYLLYQTLVGTWPGVFATDDDRDCYVQRLQRYMLKVVREAKVHTSWVSPNEQYESSIPQFVASLFEQPPRHPFLSDMHDFATKVADHGIWNSLSQLLVKVMSPGVPDFYQGNEQWNLTLVDPDNRHPVDFAVMRQRLDDLLDEMAVVLGIDERTSTIDAWLNAETINSDTIHNRVKDFLRDLITHRADGRIKLFTTLLALHIRRGSPDLFAGGAYQPLAVEGRFAKNVIAFARNDGHRKILVVVPRLTVGLMGFGGPPPIGSPWGDTVVFVPAQPSCRIHDLISRRVVTMTSDSPNPSLFVCEVLRFFSVAIIEVLTA